LPLLELATGGAVNHSHICPNRIDAKRKAPIDGALFVCDLVS
jgi:hypothetical protein